MSTPNVPWVVVKHDPNGCSALASPRSCVVPARRAMELCSRGSLPSRLEGKDRVHLMAGDVLAQRGTIRL